MGTIGLGKPAQYQSLHWTGPLLRFIAMLNGSKFHEGKLMALNKYKYQLQLKLLAKPALRGCAPGLPLFVVVVYILSLCAALSVSLHPAPVLMSYL
jgi:hypothetical protein